MKLRNTNTRIRHPKEHKGHKVVLDTEVAEKGQLGFLEAVLKEICHDILSHFSNVDKVLLTCEEN